MICEQKCPADNLIGIDEIQMNDLEDQVEEKIPKAKNKRQPSKIKKQKHKGKKMVRGKKRFERTDPG